MVARDVSTLPCREQQAAADHSRPERLVASMRRAGTGGRISDDRQALAKCLDERVEADEAGAVHRHRYLPLPVAAGAYRRHVRRV